MKVSSSSLSAEQVSAGGPIELMKKVLLASHLQLARSLNLWHVLAGIVNKIRLPLQANPALYMSSQLWTCHLFPLYGIFKSIEKVFYPVFFFTLSFLSVPHFLDVSPSSDHSSLFWPWKKAEREERDTLTGFPFVRLIVCGRRRERVQAKGAGYKMGGFGGGGRPFQWLLPPISLCYSPERWRARQDLINDQAFWIGLYKVWQNGSFHHKFKAEKSERLSKERGEKEIFSGYFLLSSFFLFPGL